MGNFLFLFFKLLAALNLFIGEETLIGHLMYIHQRVVFIL